MAHREVADRQKPALHDAVSSSSISFSARHARGSFSRRTGRLRPAPRRPRAGRSRAQPLSALPLVARSSLANCRRWSSDQPTAASRRPPRFAGAWTSARRGGWAADADRSDAPATAPTPPRPPCRCRARSRCRPSAGRRAAGPRPSRSRVGHAAATGPAAAPAKWRGRHWSPQRDLQATVYQSLDVGLRTAVRTLADALRDGSTSPGPAL